MLERYFTPIGLVLCAAHGSAAVLADGSTPPEPSDGATDQLPSAEPGHRMPHLWLTPDRSTLDAFGAWFTLLTPDPARWVPQAAAPWPLRIEPLADGPPASAASPRAERCSSGPTATSVPAVATVHRATPPSARPSPRSRVWGGPLSRVLVPAKLSEVCRRCDQPV